MIITEDKSDARYQIKAYHSGNITVNSETYTHSLIIGPNVLLLDWAPQSLAELSLKDWQAVIDLKPKILLLGTGDVFQKPKHAILAPIYAANIGIEIMNTGAACRTYTALIAENRNVIAALLLNK